MDTDDVVLILNKVEDDLCDMLCDISFDNFDKQSFATKLENLLDFVVQDMSFDIEKSSELKEIKQ